MKLASKQQGVALIMVLLIVAIVSVLATEMGARLQLQVKRASNIKENNQAYWYAVGAEQFAKKSISKLIENSKGVIHLDPLWSDEFVFPIEGGGIEAQLFDMQACFNLNGLKDKASTTSNAFTRSPELSERLSAFYRLLEQVEPEITSFERETVRDSLADWLDSDDNMSQLGAEDSTYESLQFPYMAANNYMADISELRLVNGVQQAWLKTLMQWVCVLPAENIFLLNVNTVTEENAAILASMANLSISDAKSIIASRPPDGFQNAADFLALTQVTAANLTDDQKAWFTVTTDYFMLSSKTSYNNASFAMQTLFKVENNQVSVKKRQFGIQ